MLLPMLVQKSVSPGRSATSIIKWRNPASSLQGSMWDWFAISIQGWQICHTFKKNLQLDEFELVDSLANKVTRRHKAMLISQRLNPETGYLATFVEHCKRAKTTDNIAVAKFYASDEDNDTKRHKKRPNLKEREENGKIHRKKNPSLYCSLHGENKSHTSKECNVLKKRAKDKDNPKYGKSITRRSSNSLISSRQKLPTKGPSIKAKQIFCQEEYFQRGEYHSR